MPYLHDAFDIFRGQRGNTLSFTDSMIVAIARSEGVRHVATFDRAFERIGGIEVVPGR